ncbi:PREDICTED: TMV resistance [Prunus dulcis]|uniref:PREDICTED: TMV resistance n=1 Tax=Prunus dulcis TaxID=3755 RepID=A0A5E4GFJ9_PRUDU|nr:PREDICTED: TMV resistance [Prunus dulcis]
MLASMANQRASSSSAAFPKSREYQVFLSFSGEDTRHIFTDHLYSDLCKQGIYTFRDDDDLRRGEEISRALLTAIEESKISVVVFSKHYAFSNWCLDELVKILDCQESKQQQVIPVFYKVNPSDVRNQRGSFGDALAYMECKYKENMQKVNKWRAALSQVASLSGFTLDEHESESKFMQNIIEGISQQVIDRTYLYVTEYPVRMCHPVENILKLLDLGEKDVRMAGLWGTGGIGKTTIAKAVYNSIAHEFEGSCFLESVRECSIWRRRGLAKLQENLLSEILRDRNLEVANVHKGATMIKHRLSCRKVLLVLDDVDDMDQLHKLVGACDWFGVGSRIIITTRDKQLLTAHCVNLIYEVKILDDPEALELFCWHAFKRSEPPLGDYVKFAERAIRYAQGLPLALEVLGSYLYGGSIDKWEAALDGFKSRKIQDVLKISYDALDYIVKEVFLDIACFFKGKSRRDVTEILLVAGGLNPMYSIEVLIEKALISVEGNQILMHNLLEEMGKDIVRQESPGEPGQRSRLWFHEDVYHVFANNTGTNRIRGIVANFPNQDDKICLNLKSFSTMKNLKIFIIRNGCISGDIGCLPRSLLLRWNRCHLQPFNRNKERGERLKAKKASAIAAKDKGRRLLHECTEKQKVVMKSRLEQGRLNLLMEWRFGLEEDYGPTVGDDQ